MSATFGRGKVRLLGLEISDNNPLLDTAVDQIRGLFPDLSARTSVSAAAIRCERRKAATF
ncbi:MAG: hypothetical protein R3C08_03485 [Hyphomonas sp.]